MAHDVKIRAFKECPPGVTGGAKHISIFIFFLLESPADGSGKGRDMSHYEVRGLHQDGDNHKGICQDEG